VRRVSVRR